MNHKGGRTMKYEGKGSSKSIRSIIACILVLITLLVPGCTAKNDQGTDEENTSARYAVINEFSRSLESVRYNDIDIICGFPEEKMKSAVLYSLDAAGNKKIIYRPEKKMCVEELELSGEWIYFFEMKSDREENIYFPGPGDRYVYFEEKFLSKVKVDGTGYQQIKKFNKNTLSLYNLRVDDLGNIYYMKADNSPWGPWLCCYNPTDGSEKIIGDSHTRFDLRDGKVYAVNETDLFQHMFDSNRTAYESKDKFAMWSLHVYSQTAKGSFAEEKRLDIPKVYVWMMPIEHEGSIYYLHRDDTKLTLCRRSIDGDWSEEVLYSFDKLVDTRNMHLFDGYIYYYECEEEFFVFPGLSSGFFYDKQTALCRRKLEPGAEEEIIYLPGMEASENRESFANKEDSAKKKSSANEKKEIVLPYSYGKMCYFGDCIVIEKFPNPFDITRSYDPGYEYVSFVKVDLTIKRAIEIGGGKRTKTSIGFKEYYYWTGAGRNLILSYPVGRNKRRAEDKIFSMDDESLRSLRQL